MLDVNLGTLRDNIISLLEAIESRITPPKQAHIFMINSLDVILNTFIGAKMVDVEDARVLKKSFDNHVSKFIEEELDECYGKMIAFLKLTEPQISRNSTHMQVSHSMHTL